MTLEQMKKETKKELFNGLEKLRNEIDSSNRDLNKSNNKKESWFNKKEYLSGNIRGKIKSINENRTKRDSLTKKVKELKEKRNKLNEGIRKKISELVKLKNRARDLAKNLKIEGAQNLKGYIDKIEVRMETEAMSFEKEKKLSKKLKVLKKSLRESSAIIDIHEKIKKLNLEINGLKKNNNETHNEVQKLAKESQELHESIIKNSKEIDRLKVQEEEAFKKFFDFKKNFSYINNKLKEKLVVMNILKGKINKFELEEEEKRKLKETTLIKNKEHEMEEKIKEGKKLTTEDFLAFQEIIKNN
ncbi:MAG: hypothetical protein QF798_03310 [Candidatus Woesearchaeota archaeon]|jgi:structural maintenance of chromosome 3 (chondroitin sulfate proteoglycan 6)|nr:hypothetical protein [Candidatus Woesearchaeota archaeon]|tara:strand:- start:8680 stop:9582 length:903 start_codon:yes stop_codon:yes gene_type:complete